MPLTAQGTPGLVAVEQHLCLCPPTAAFPLCLRLHMVFSGHVSMSRCPSSHKDTSHIGLEPTLMTLFNSIASIRTLFPNQVTLTGTGS